MPYALADLEHARREVLDLETRIADARVRIDLIERQGRDTTDVRLVLGQLEKARRRSVERLGAIRGAIAPDTF